MVPEPGNVCCSVIVIIKITGEKNSGSKKCGHHADFVSRDIFLFDEDKSSGEQDRTAELRQALRVGKSIAQLFHGFGVSGIEVARTWPSLSTKTKTNYEECH